MSSTRRVPSYCQHEILVVGKFISRTCDKLTNMTYVKNQDGLDIPTKLFYLGASNQPLTRELVNPPSVDPKPNPFLGLAHPTCLVLSRREQFVYGSRSLHLFGGEMEEDSSSVHSQKRPTGSWVAGKRKCHPPNPHQKFTPLKRHKNISSTSESQVVVVQKSSSSNKFIQQSTSTSTSISIQSHHSKKRRKPKIREDSTSNRRWVFSSRDCSRFKDKVIIVSYNILGVENASKHPDLYQQVPPRFLKWNWRKKLIRDELIRYRPGILCFQEVDRFSDLADLLQQDGFQGVYKARTGEAHDGCAIFWREELFSLLHQDDIEFRKFGLRDNVAQFCVLKMNANHSNDGVNAQLSQTTTRTLLVGNIHVLFNPKRGDIKLGQVRLFVEKANAISQEWGSIPIVLAGDLNSMPQSAIYQFLASSELDILLHDRRNISGQIESSPRWNTFRYPSEDANSLRRSIARPLRYEWSNEELQIAAGSGGSTHLQHHLKLSSSYVGVSGTSSTRDRCGEPLATSYHSKFLGTVDYIWHSKELIPVGVLETLPVKILRETGGLPSKKWGSDHLALVCELAFEDNSDGT